MQHRVKTIFCFSYLMAANFSHADETKAPGQGVTLNIAGSLIQPMSCTLRPATYELGSIPVQDFDRQDVINLRKKRSTVLPLENCSKDDQFHLSLTVTKATDFDGYVPFAEGAGMVQGLHLYILGYLGNDLGKNFQRFLDDSADGLYLFLEKKEFGGQVTAGKILGKVIATLTPL